LVSRTTRSRLQSGDDLVTRAITDQLTLLENKQSIDQRKERRAMSGDDNCHVTSGEHPQPLEKFGFAAQIEMRRRFVEEKNLRPADHGAREPDGLFLPSRKAAATFRNGHVVAKRMRCRELLYACQAGRFENLVIGRCWKAEGNIVAKLTEDQVDVLENEADPAPQIRRLVLAKIHALNQDAALVRLVETGQQTADRRLA